MAKLNLVEQCRQILAQHWRKVVELAEADALKDWLVDAELVNAIRKSINSRTKTYRYVLPTQLVAKLADQELDCRCIQMGRGGAGAFDARTIAHGVVVPFDRTNERVLGGSPEPYVNNPLRIPAISKDYREPQKDKAGWDDLCVILERVETEGKISFTQDVLRQVLNEVYTRLGKVNVAYPAPRRISLERAIQLIEDFTDERSGGERFEAVTAALFLALGRCFGLFTKVRRAKVTAADASAGMLADIECVNESNEIVLAVEAKDRKLTITQLQDKIPGLREHHVSEAFFVAGQGIDPNDDEAVRELVTREFVSGQNLYITDLLSLARVVLALLGEPGRRLFLGFVGEQLDAYCDVHHRRAWSQLLAEL